MNTNSMDLEVKLIENVVEKQKFLLSQAKEKVDKTINSAKEEVETINTESEKQILSLAGSELRAVNDRIVGSAELEGRKILMEARQKLLSKVFEEAERRLEIMAGIMGSDYTDILVKMISESISAIGGDEFMVAANERDLAFHKKNLSTINVDLKKTLGGIIKLDEEPIEIIGGVVVRNTDATKTYYNTLRGTLEKVRSRIEAEVAEILGVI